MTDHVITRVQLDPVDLHIGYTTGPRSISPWRCWNLAVDEQRRRILKCRMIAAHIVS
jgi:hypothetical protein